MLPETYSFTLGTFKCIAIRDTDAPLKDRARDFLAKSVPDDALQAALLRHHHDDGMFEFSINPLYIDTGHHRVLIDTGVGPGVEGVGEGKLCQRLQAAGVAPSAVDRVILTHGHWDHIGYNVDSQGKAVFPNARFTMWKSEWEWWMNEHNLSQMDSTNASFARHNLPPLKDRFDLIDTETDIVPGICALRAPGHTLGQIALRITSGRAGLLHLADVAHDPIEFEHPDWSPWFEADVALSEASRRKLLALAADENLLVMTSHFAFPGVGHVTREGDGFRWEPVGG